MERNEKAREQSSDTSGFGLKSRPAREDSQATMNIGRPPPLSSSSSSSSALRDQPPSEMALPSGYRLHEYRLEFVLGHGGFGITYLAVDVNLNARVAIKEYLPRNVAYRERDTTVVPRSAEWEEFYEQGLENFLVEARTLATFRHPNIVRVARFFEANGTAYIVLEYERGRSLKQAWDRNSRMSEGDLLALLAPLLHGLGVVHASGFLHRDIKPDNIRVRDDDGSLILLDFGSARETSAQRDDDVLVFTPGYAPIEQQLSGDQGPWTDIYALGATLYWMISGEKPLDALDRMKVDRLSTAVSVGTGRYRTKFLEAIDWALKPHAKDRPRDIEAFRTALYAEHPGALNLKDALAVGGGGDSSAGEPLFAKLAIKRPRVAWARIRRLGRSVMRPGSWPTVVKLTIALVATALTPMLITARYNLIGSTERVNQAEIRNLEQLAGSVAGRVAQLVGDSKNLAEYLATDDDFVGYLGKPTTDRVAGLKSKLDRLVRANRDVQLAMVFDTSGTAVVSSDPEVMGKNFKFREYFKRAMAGEPFMTGIVVGAVAGQPGVFFSNPVRSPGGDVIGAVVLRIKGQSVAAILAAARQDARTPFLIDGDGVLIDHPDETKLYDSLVPLSAEALERIKADRRFRRDTIESVNMPDLARAMVAAKHVGNVSYTSTISRKQEIAGYAPVNGSDWVVGVTETRDTFEGPLNHLFDNVLKSVALVGAVFLLVAMFFARTIVRPIERLTRAVHALKSGDYEKAHVKVTSRDEVGELSRVFNVMIDVLRQRDREPAAGAKEKRGPNSRRSG